MRLNIFFAAIDLLILLVYPFVYIIHQIRKMTGARH